MTALDRRLNAFRDDLADVRLRGRIEAPRFAAGRRARVAAPLAGLRRLPDENLAHDTELLFGDEVTVFDETDGWCWVQAARDGYVGYCRASALGPIEAAPTHVVSAPRTWRYERPDLKGRAVDALSLGSSLTIGDFVEHRGTRYAVAADGTAVVAGHLRPVDRHIDDYVAAAELLAGTPYLWGGATAFGIDCSGLVQLAMRMTGRDVLRNSDMQAATIGAPIDPAEGLQRGDLVFWKGHVAILTAAAGVIHANGHTMLVSAEPLAQAVERIGYLYGQPTGYRRP